MIQFNKKILFLLFALTLFLLGILISQIINDGFKTGKGLVFEIMQFLSLIITSSIFFVKLYLPKNKNQ